jgi:SAM-dependent methyltransferase
MKRFQDHFSRQARNYARYRPQYPDGLFAWLASEAPCRRLAWDCGTGNGQAALRLAAHFDRVVATDASADQLQHAVAHDRIEYRVARAEDSGLEPGGVSVVTVAAAVHWFDLTRFYQEVRRGAAPDGLLAVWTYHQPFIAPAIDRALMRYHDEVVGDYWPEGFHFVIDHYRRLPFPFAEIPSPPFEAEAHWDLDQLRGFLGSWSATQRYREERGEDPVMHVWPEFEQAWDRPAQPRRIRFPLYLRVGRVR